MEWRIIALNFLYAALGVVRVHRLSTLRLVNATGGFS